MVGYWLSKKLVLLIQDTLYGSAYAIVGIITQQHQINYRVVQVLVVVCKENELLNLQKAEQGRRFVKDIRLVKNTIVCINVTKICLIVATTKITKAIKDMATGGFAFVTNG